MTNLAGGQPFCGTVKLSTYMAQSKTDATAQALEKVRHQVQGQKIEAAGSLMAELDSWIESWPVSINDSGWDNVDSDRFNQIVKNGSSMLPLLSSVRSPTSRVTWTVG